MKTSKVSGSVSVLLTLAACDMQTLEQVQVSDAQDLEDVTAPSSFHAGVGAPIDAALGARWIENHRQTTESEVASYLIEAATLRQFLELPGCVGIGLYHAVDDSGQPRLFPIGVDSEGRAIAGATVPVEARRSIRRYVGPARYHFFGRNTFHRLLDEQGVALVRATPALDEQGAPQLLLSDAAETEPSSYEDVSMPSTSDELPGLPEP